MELFTIALPQYESINKLQQLLDHEVEAELHSLKAVGGAPLVELRVNQPNIISCVALLPRFQLKPHGSLMYRAAANAVAEYIVDMMEQGLLSDIIRRKYTHLQGTDVAMIERYCNDLLHGQEWEGLGSKFQEADRLRRKGKIAEELEQYLEAETRLNIDGVVKFRLAPYRKELTEIVEYALDEYVLDKQYQEFISLLKYFVQLQESKMSLVHLLHKGNHEFAMYNEQFKPLEAKPPSDRIVAEMLETEMNIEDMVISSLISVSPKQIMVHTRHPEMQVIRTIETIFDGRVKVCVKCPSCATTLDELIQP